MVLTLLVGFDNFYPESCQGREVHLIPSTFLQRLQKTQTRRPRVGGTGARREPPDRAVVHACWHRQPRPSPTLAPRARGVPCPALSLGTDSPGRGGGRARGNSAPSALSQRRRPTLRVPCDPPAAPGAGTAGRRRERGRGLQDSAGPAPPPPRGPGA